MSTEQPTASCDWPWTGASASACAPRATLHTKVLGSGVLWEACPVFHWVKRAAVQDCEKVIFRQFEWAGLEAQIHNSKSLVL